MSRQTLDNSELGSRLHMKNSQVDGASYTHACLRSSRRWQSATPFRDLKLQIREPVLQRNKEAAAFDALVSRASCS